jgi:hypothetical protein
MTWRMCVNVDDHEVLLEAASREPLAASFSIQPEREPVLR